MSGYLAIAVLVCIATGGLTTIPPTTQGITAPAPTTDAPSNTSATTNSTTPSPTVCVCPLEIKPVCQVNPPRPQGSPHTLIRIRPRGWLSRCVAKCYGITNVRPCYTGRYHSVTCKCPSIIWDPVCDVETGMLFRSRCQAKCAGNPSVKPCEVDGQIVVRIK